MNKKLLTADIGGTRSRFMTFDGLISQDIVEFNNKNFNSFDHLLTQLSEEHPSFLDCHSCCFALAGIGDSNHVKITNLPWIIDRKKIINNFKLKSLFFLNDLEASAYGIELLPEESFKVLQEGVKNEGNIALISPGTGLGQSFLSPSGNSFHTEGGHTDFAPIDELQVELWRYIKERLGRVSYESVLSGPGIWMIYNFLKEKESYTSDFIPSNQKDVRIGAFKFHDHLCIQTLRLFVKCLAQEAGNVALHTLAKKGVYIGGGIAVHLLPYLEEQLFLDSFSQKGPLTSFLQSVPIKVMLDERSTLFGCAWYCLHGNV